MTRQDAYAKNNGRIRFVLVRPEVAGNIGAVARVLRNFGISDLVLVAPVADPMSPEAFQRATHGQQVLASAKRVDRLDEALAGCVGSAAFSSNDAGLIRRGMAGSPAETLPKLVALSHSGPVALVFGPEPSGLSTAEVARCDHLITIPANKEYSALNLSHAVAIAAYEVFRAESSGEDFVSESAPATDDERERMFRHLKKALEDVHFLWDDKAELLFHGLRQIIIRARPTHNDVQLLHGIARQLEWVVRTGYQVPDPVKDASISGASENTTGVPPV
ncbi:MAG: RNA methyltransferase [Gemmataceae bacterium]|nr:RNA methyltransferase [Gemmataceae bacterium]